MSFVEWNKIDTGKLVTTLIRRERPLLSRKKGGKRHQHFYKSWREREQFRGEAGVWFKKLNQKGFCLRVFFLASKSAEAEKVYELIVGNVVASKSLQKNALARDPPVTITWNNSAREKWTEFGSPSYGVSLLMVRWFWTAALTCLVDGNTSWAVKVFVGRKLISSSSGGETQFVVFVTYTSCELCSANFGLERAQTLCECVHSPRRVDLWVR